MVNRYFQALSWFISKDIVPQVSPSRLHRTCSDLTNEWKNSVSLKLHSPSHRKLVQWSRTAFQEDMIDFIFLKEPYSGKNNTTSYLFLTPISVLLTFSHDFMEYLSGV